MLRNRRKPRGTHPWEGAGEGPLPMGRGPLGLPSSKPRLWSSSVVKLRPTLFFPDSGSGRGWTKAQTWAAGVPFYCSLSFPPPRACFHGALGRGQLRERPANFCSGLFSASQCQTGALLSRVFYLLLCLGGRGSEKHQSRTWFEKRGKPKTKLPYRATLFLGAVAPAGPR